MIILDTDAVSNLMRPRPSPLLIERLAETALDEQATTTITIGELTYGAHKAGRPELYERAAGLLNGVQILVFDQPAAERYGPMRADLESAGRPLADPDLRIASIALTHQATLITGNYRHFARVPGLTVRDWINGQGEDGDQLPGPKAG
jgi:tRNA(fMet)-specific endonuclease VapC